MNRTITTTELKALWRRNRVPLKAGAQMRRPLSRRALLRPGLATGAPCSLASPRSVAVRHLDAGQPDPVALVGGAERRLPAKPRRARQLSATAAYRRLGPLMASIGSQF